MHWESRCSGTLDENWHGHAAWLDALRVVSVGKTHDEAQPCCGTRRLGEFLGAGVDRGGFRCAFDVVCVSSALAAKKRFRENCGPTSEAP